MSNDGSSKKDAQLRELLGLNKSNRYSITWYCNIAKPSKYSGRSIDVAVCEYSDGVAFIVVHKPSGPPTIEALNPFIIYDVTVTDKICSDGKWCLNLDCPLNKADMEHFRKRGLPSRSKLAEAHETLEKIKKQLNLKITESGGMIVYKKPPVYIQKKRKVLK